MSSAVISGAAIQGLSAMEYSSTMAQKPKASVARIRFKRPPPLFLQEWMDKFQLSGEEMAGRMDCSPGTVSKLLNGKMKITEEWKARFVDALGHDVTVPDLYRHPDRPTQEDLLRGLSDDQKDRVIKAIRAFTGMG